MSQPIDPASTPLPGGTVVTFSVLMRNKSATATFRYGFTNNSNNEHYAYIDESSTIGDKWTLFTLTTTLENSASNWQAVLMFTGKPGSVDILAAKLELGDKQTLAHQDASGNWVLNEIPDYGEELRKCQRFYRRLYFSYLKFAHYASGVARVGIPINGMRTKPSCNIIGTPTCYAEDNWSIASLALGLNVNERTAEMEAANVDLAVLEGSGAISNKVVCNDLLVEVISDL